MEPRILPSLLATQDQPDRSRPPADLRTKIFVDACESMHQRLVEFCRKRVKDAALAEDLAQETFARAFARLSTFDPHRPMWPWLMRIAENAIIDLSRQRLKPIPVDFSADGTWKEQAEPDPALEQILAGDRRRHLRRVISRLPARQRRALMLYAVEGWTYPQIAEVEGLSHVAVKSLIWRARESLRESRILKSALVVTLFAVIRSKVRQGVETTKNVASRVRMEGLAAIGDQLGVSLIALTTIAVSGLQVANPSAEALTRVSQITAPNRQATHGVAADGRNGSYDRDGAAADPLTQVERELIDPARGAAPEDAQISSFAVSQEDPNLIYMAGTIPCGRGVCPGVLFRSVDNGRSWFRMPALDFASNQVLLPPVGRRVFAMGPMGLQESDDGGQTFRLASPLGGGIAIPPSYARGDIRVLIGNSNVVEYLPEHGITRPSAFPVASRGRSSIAFPPRYAPGTDTTGLVSESPVFIGTTEAGASWPVWRSMIHRCLGSICSEIPLEGSSHTPEIRLSPRFEKDGIAVAFTTNRMYVSRDDGTNFSPIPAPDGLNAITDVAITRDGSLYAAGFGSNDTGLYTSSDLGRTWQLVRITVQGFRGVTALLVKDDGILVGGVTSGVACSTDNGHSWQRRCAS